MIVPLAMTLWFSFQRYNLLQPDPRRLRRVRQLRAGSALARTFWVAIINTLLLVGGVLVITVVGGILIALLIDQPIWGQGIVRILVISPFFVMPPVAALIWKNMFMHPANGLFAGIATLFGLQPIDWFAQVPAVLGHLHRRLAVAALRHADPADRAAVA